LRLSVTPVSRAMRRDIGQEILDGIEAIKTDGGVHHAAAFTLEDFFNKHYPGQTEGAVYLRGIRSRENLSQTKPAELTGIPRQHISEMENGKRPIGMERAKLLAGALNADCRAFL